MSFRAGLVALVGKPNVGKSTIVNALVGQKVSIVSKRPQTTRRRVLGIIQGAGFQIGLLDTPGIHEPHSQLGKEMVAQARGALGDVDAVLVVIDSSKPPDSNDEALARILASMAERRAPVILALNKMDLLRPEHVQKHVDLYTKLFGTDRYMLTTATKGVNLELLLEQLASEMPVRERMFPDDEYTDQSSRFLCAELIREQVLAATRQELPYAAAVQIEEWTERPDGLLEIRASIFVERTSQRPIIIGKHGQTIKRIGTLARAEIEAVLGRHIHLDLHVVVRENWRMSPQVLRELEYAE